MSRLLTAALLLAPFAAAQTPFTPGNVVVVRMGDGVAALNANATPVFLEEWNPATSTLVQTINLTTAGSNLVTSSGTATSEGFLTLSANGQYLVYAGYKTAVGTASITGSTSASINRVIARIALNGTVDSTTALTDAVSGGNPRSAVTTDGTLFWICGSAGGVRHAASLGALTSTQINSTNPVNLRVIGIQNGQLYASSSASANFGINSVGSGLPTTSGQTVSILPGFPTATGPSTYDYWFADANTVYVADDRAVASGGGLQKWTFNGSTWSLAYTLNTSLTAGLRGVTGVPGSSPRQLFATDTSSKLVGVTDNGTNASSPFTTVTTVGTNRAFRGLRFIPVPAPVIDTQPTSAVACAGSGAAFTVGASGSGLAYQWRKNSVGIGGANAATYSIAAVGTGDIGSYDCVVSNAGGSVTSTAATLTVNTGPSIDTSPSSATVCAGGGTSFGVAVSGTAPFSYQWRKNGSPISGANAATLSIASAGAADAGSYDCVVANSCSTSTSAAATLTVNESAVIGKQPGDATACSGTGASFSVTATGTAPITYQWRRNGSPIAGANAATLTIAAAVAADAGAYDCEVSNACGSTSSAFATLTVDEAAAVSVNPIDATACSGTGASFSVTATGTAPITYQWRRNGSPIAGATAATLTIAAAIAADAGAYDCEVSNACGSTSSAFATLTVDETAAVTVNPVDATACSGTGASFSVTATGTAPITYQWRKNGSPIPGANAATFAIAAAVAADAGAYDCEVSNACGSATSAFAVLTVNELAAIQTQPVGQTVLLGNTTVFSVLASSVLPLSFQWRRDGNPIAGATNNVFAIYGTTLADAGAYDVEVTNDCGAVFSNTAALFVTDVPALEVASFSFGLNPATAVGDFVLGNGNDLVVATRTGSVQVMQNDGTGHFAPLPPLALGSNLQDLVAADFDLDGFADVAIISSTALYVLYGAGDGTFSAPTTVLTYAPAIVNVAAAPLLSHTASDLAFSVDNGVWVVMNAANSTPGARGFGPPTFLHTGTAFSDLATGDITGDGRPDIVSADTGSNHLRVVDGATLSTFFDSVLAAGLRSIAVRDLDGDSIADVAVNTLTSVCMLHGPVLNTIILDPTPNTTAVTAGNFDLDPAVDLAYADAAGQIVVLHNVAAAGGPGSRDVLTSPFAGSRLTAAALSPVGQFAGPMADPDELVLDRSPEVVVVRFRARAEATLVAGTGCGGATPVHSVTGGAPVLGNAAFMSELDLATPNTFAAFAYQGHYPAGSPLTLSSLGGCTHAFDPGMDLPLLFAVVDGTGHAAVSIAVPPLPLFIGIEFPVQWAVFDGGPFLGLTLSPALLLRIGEY